MSLAKLPSFAKHRVDRVKKSNDPVNGNTQTPKSLTNMIYCNAEPVSEEQRFLMTCQLADNEVLLFSEWDNLFNEYTVVEQVGRKF